jgi:hypothetical protein
MMKTNNGHSPAQIDYDLHGLVGIRLLEAAPAEVEAVTRQLGPVQQPLTREPDITIRFVERLSTNGPIRYLGVDEAGFTADAFLVLRSKHKVPAKVQINFRQIGGPCEIVCERGLPAIPLLIPILNLTALANGALPLHASAFTYNGTGVLTTGWSKGGKTETLLAFMSQGASYIGDEWVYLSQDGQHMVGIPEPIRVWDWHLQELPSCYWNLVSHGDRTRLRAIKLTQAVDQTLSSGPGRELLPAKILKRIRPILKRQLHIDMHPQKLFGAGFSRLIGKLDKVLFVASHESPEVTIQPIEPQEIARRMVFSLQYERLNFMSYYLAFRFAFPEVGNSFIEQAETLQRQRLTHLLAGKEAHAVYHPYPVSLPALFEAISPLL